MIRKMAAIIVFVAGLNSLALERARAQCPPLTLQHTFYDSTPAGTSEFGQAVAASDNRLLVGSWHDQSVTYDGEGSASLFNAGSGALIKKINNPNPTAFDYFGWAVAVSDTYAIVGAYDDDTDGLGSGIAYVFNASTGALVATLHNPSTATVLQFGYTVAVSGNNVVVAAPYAIEGFYNPGIVYLFDATSGMLLQTIHAPDLGGVQRFGVSLGISGNKVLVGTPAALVPDLYGGVAYLFDAVSASHLQTFHNPTGTIGQDFGASAAISGDNVIIGTPHDNTAGTNTGTVYLFNASSGDLIHTFNDPAAVTNDQFGFSLSVSGNNILVGAPFDDTDFNNSGLVYLFDAITWSLVQRIHTPALPLAEYYASTVAIAGTNVIVGAPNNFDKAAESGVAYHFGCPLPTSTPLPSPSPTPYDDAVYLSDTVPAQIPAGETVGFGVTLRNVGNTPWTAAGGYLLGVVNDPCGILLDNRFPVVEETSADPNQPYQFILYLRSPPSPGPCAVALQMYHEGGVGLFGEVITRTINVGPAPTNPARDWTFYE